MIRHWMRLIWNRKRANFLIMIEIFVSFLVLEGVMLVAAQYVYNYRHPLGFSIDDVLDDHVDPKSQDDDARARETARPCDSFCCALRDMPEIEAAAGTFTPPYGHASWVSGFNTHGHALDYRGESGTDGFRDVFSLDLRRGRWFSHEDDAATDQPLVINDRLRARDFRRCRSDWQRHPAGSEAVLVGE